MRALKFTLSGKTAFFKKPEVNTYCYFTYGNIHKIALLGILGAIMGFKGYNQQARDVVATYPEFYERLKDVKLAIVPMNDNGYIPKKVQVFNNSVGYASREQGGNLIVKEQWLEEPKWDIYILLQGEIEEKLANRLIERRFHYLPYLGKNDHMADIEAVKILENLEGLTEVEGLKSLFIKEEFDIQTEHGFFKAKTPGFKYQEMLPVALEGTTNKYELATFIYTNETLKSKKSSTVYRCEGRNIFFF